MSALDALDVLRRPGCGLPRVQRAAAPDVVRSPYRDVVDATGGVMPWDTAPQAPPACVWCAADGRTCARCARVAARRGAW